MGDRHVGDGTKVFISYKKVQVAGIDSWAEAIDQEFFKVVSSVVDSLTYLGFNCRLTRMTIQRFK